MNEFYLDFFKNQDSKLELNVTITKPKSNKSSRYSQGFAVV